MDLRQLETQAAEEAVTSHTIGIIGGTEDGPCTGIGTGVAVQWQQHRMILTAAHVVGTTDPSQLRFLFRPEGTIQRKDLEKRTAQARFFRAERVDVRGIRRFDPLDLASIDIPPDLDANYPVTFFSLDPAAVTPAPGTVVMIIGFPSALGQTVNTEGLAASRAIAYERLEDPTVISGLDLNAHFAVTYTYGDSVEPQGIHPGGFSGAGIWSYQETGSLVRRPSPALDGILTTFYPMRRLTTGIRVEAVVRALSEVIDA